MFLTACVVGVILGVNPFVAALIASIAQIDVIWDESQAAKAEGSHVDGR
jgi:hypothetical protein